MFIKICKCYNFYVRTNLSREDGRIAMLICNRLFACIVMPVNCKAISHRYYYKREYELSKTFILLLNFSFAAKKNWVVIIAVAVC